MHSHVPATCPYPEPIPVASRSKAQVSGRSPAEIESHRGHGCLSVVNVVCCQAEVSASGRSLVHRSPTDCGASLCVIWKSREWGGPGCCAKYKQQTNGI